MKKRYVLSLIVVFLMVMVSDILGEKEVIFPEIAALCVGFLVIDKRVWLMNNIQFVGIMTFMAITGTALVNWGADYKILNYFISFAVVSSILILTRTTLYPAISAGMLPILLNSGSWIYPVTVFVLSLMMVVIRRVMLNHGWLSIAVGGRQEGRIMDNMLVWLLRIIFYAIPAIASFALNLDYLLVPPLVVAFVEMSRQQTNIHEHPYLISFQLVAASIIGTAGIYLFHNGLDVPLCIVAVLVLSIVFCMFELTHRRFAPAAAISLVPCLIPADILLIFPIYVLIGTIIFVLLGLQLRKLLNIVIRAEKSLLFF